MEDKRNSRQIFLDRAQAVSRETIQDTPAHPVSPPDSRSLVERLLESDGGIVALPVVPSLGTGYFAATLGFPELGVFLSVALFTGGAAYLDWRRESPLRRYLGSQRNYSRTPPETYNCD